MFLDIKFILNENAKSSGCARRTITIMFFIHLKIFLFFGWYPISLNVSIFSSSMFVIYSFCLFLFYLISVEKSIDISKGIVFFLLTLFWKILKFWFSTQIKGKRFIRERKHLFKSHCMFDLLLLDARLDVT